MVCGKVATDGQTTKGHCRCPHRGLRHLHVLDIDNVGAVELARDLVRMCSTLVPTLAAIRLARDVHLKAHHREHRLLGFGLIQRETHRRFVVGRR